MGTCVFQRMTAGKRAFLRLLSVAVLAACSGSLFVIPAQTTLGDLSGTILDPSGAGVPGAKVAVINEATKARRVGVSDATGAYRVDGLFVGAYTIEVEAAGFKRHAQTNISITPATMKSVDVQLQIGETAETIQVTDVAPAIESETPALTTGIPKIAYSEMPLMNESRAGYTFDPLTWVPGSASGNAIYSFAGNRPSMQQANLEGMQHDQYSLKPPTSAISEVNVILSNAPAEYARPVTMDATFKSGTNRLTGEFMANFVNPCTDARSSPFNNPSYPPCKTQWRFFPSVGGPVYIPKVYDGRNKSFFFFTLNKNPNQALSGIPRIASVPTLAMQKGDLSKYPATILDPLTGTPFAGNVIPANRISAFANGVVGDYYGSRYNYVGGPDSYVNNGALSGRDNASGHTYAMRFDHNLGSKDIFSFSYQYQKYLYSQDRALSSPASSGETRVNTQSAVDLKGRVASLSHTHTFTPSIVSQARVGVTRTLFSAYQPTSDFSDKLMGPDVVSRWGIQGINAPGLSGMPQFFINNWNFSSGDNENYSWDTRYQFYDNISIHRGSHAIKFGYSGTKLLEDGTAKGNYFGSFNFDGRFTGEPWADFLLGVPSTFQRFATRPVIARRRWEHGAFIQDDWRISKRLTLYYGLRWSRFTVPYDKNGLFYNFDPVTMSLIVPDDFAKSQVNPAWPAATFPVKTAKEAGFSDKLINGHNNWNPRLGFAYKIGANGVLRGGYGVYTGAQRFNELQVTGPYAITENFINAANPAAPGGARYSFPNPFPSSAAVASVLSINAFSRDYHTPYSQNWNLTYEQQIFKSWGARATYRGVKSSQLIWSQDLNEVRASAAEFSEARRPYPGLQNINLIQNGANDRYQALMFEVTRPFTSDLYFTAAYTRSWSYTEAPGGQFESDQTAYVPEYAYDRARDGGSNGAFPSHDIVGNFVYTAPFGPGKKFGSDAHWLVRGLLANWSVSGTFSWRSGWFFTPMLDGVDPGNIGKFSDRRPNVVAGCDVYANQSIGGRWFNPACFTAPPSGQLGNVEVNSLQGPSAWVFNVNPFKEFPLSVLREGMKLRFGANIYNLLNHPSYGVPIQTITSPQAGQITRTEYARGWAHDYGGQRQFVFDLRLIF